MKNLTLLFAVLLAASVALTACSSSKKLANATKSEQIQTPLSKAKYKTDKTYYRAVQNGTSPDLSTAKRIALLQAKADLASQIASTLKVVSENYTNQRNVDDLSEFEASFDENVRSTTNQELTQVRIVEEEVYKKKKEASYTVWVCVEVSKEVMAEKIADRIGQDNRLKLQFDKDRFMEVFNAEMAKYEQ